MQSTLNFRRRIWQRYRNTNSYKGQTYWSLITRNLKWKSNSRDHFDRIPIKNLTPWRYPQQKTTKRRTIIFKKRIEFIIEVEWESKMINDVVSTRFYKSERDKTVFDSLPRRWFIVSQRGLADPVLKDL